nr:unnamed protein product [Callosobruchus analis]
MNLYEVFVTDWYNRPTFSERFLNFNSEHHLKNKLNTINNLKHRVTQLSYPSIHQKNLENVKEYLLKNNYPVKLVDKLLKKAINLQKRTDFE